VGVFAQTFPQYSLFEGLQETFLLELSTKKSFISTCSFIFSRAIL
jgi:hypothetical protein